MLTPLQGFGLVFGFAFLSIGYAVYPYLRRVIRLRPYNIGGDLTSPLARQLATGCHMNAQFYLRWTTLRTGDSLRLGGLRESWGIEDRPSALQTLEWLRCEGHRNEMSASVQAFAGGSADASFHSRNAGCILRISEAFAFLEANGLAQSASDLQVGPAAWDYGRLATVARWCFDAGHLSEAETMAYVEVATAARQADFRSWREYALSYVLGRFLWSPGIEANQPVADLAVKLLNDARSPLATIAW